MRPIGKRKLRSSAPEVSVILRAKESYKLKSTNNSSKSSNNARILKEIQKTPTTPEAPENKDPTRGSESTPRGTTARKTQVENLQSDLSPKYIGLRSLPSSADRTSRYGRPQKYRENEGCLPSDLIGYRRRVSPTKPHEIFHFSVKEFHDSPEKVLSSINKPLSLHVVLDRIDMDESIHLQDEIIQSDEVTSIDMKNVIAENLKTEVAMDLDPDIIDQTSDPDQLSVLKIDSDQLMITEVPNDLDTDIDHQTPDPEKLSELEMDGDQLTKTEVPRDLYTDQTSDLDQLSVLEMDGNQLMKTAITKDLDIDHQSSDKLSLLEIDEMKTTVTQDLDTEKDNQISNPDILPAPILLKNEDNTEEMAKDEPSTENLVNIEFVVESTDIKDENEKVFSSEEIVEQPTDYLNNLRVQQSPDSAQGSSIDTCINVENYEIGEMYWGQMSKYPYWPCMIWPDPDGKTLAVNGMKMHKQHVDIHVRFFYNNGCRGWVRKENLMPYEGRAAYQLKMMEVARTHDKKHPLYKFIVGPHSRREMWEQAINEAEEAFIVPMDKRIATFELILQQTKELQRIKKLERRRLSMASNDNSMFGSGNMLKRMRRSPTPESPAYEEIADFSQNAKKRKRDSDASLSDHLSSELKTNEEYKNFKRVVNSFILGMDTDFSEETENILQKLWRIRENRTHNAKSSTPNPINGLKRLSTRLQNIHQRRSLPPAPPKHRESISVLPVKEKKKIEPKTRPIDEVIDDIYNLDNKYLFRSLSKENVCIVCHETGPLVQCAKNCQTWLHRHCGVLSPENGKKLTDITHDNSITHITGDTDELQNNNIEKIICSECHSNSGPVCFVCKHGGSTSLIRCGQHGCGKFIHGHCLSMFPQHNFKNKSSDEESLMCPAHVCHTCSWRSDRRVYTPIEKSKATKCILCPSAYHTDSRCIPAGTQILTQTQIICPRHVQLKTIPVNINWCIICAASDDNESLICCEMCPHSVHASCSNTETVPDGKFFCDACTHGRYPMYGEMVWAKFNSFRWWPAIIIPPPEIPFNIRNLKHQPTEFVIRFFGTNDHGWISRNRVYMYQNDDNLNTGLLRKSSARDRNFMKGVEEAKRINEIIKLKESALITNTHKIAPEPYNKIKANRLVAPVKATDLFDRNKEATPCTCDSSNPCGIGSGCLNRCLNTECDQTCPMGDKCQNRMFQKRSYANYEVKYFNEKGWGLQTVKPIKEGTFIIEYVGEIINLDEHKKRMAQQLKDKSENFYFCGLQHGYMIDAGPKGNDARFMNHSCDPNCETEKWVVNGMTRLGIFANQNIPPNTELTFNYFLESVGDGMTPCHCGSKRCSKFIGLKYESPKKAKKEEEENMKSDKKTRRKLKHAKKLRINPIVFKKASGKPKKRKRSNVSSEMVENTPHTKGNTNTGENDKTSGVDFIDHNMNNSASINNDQ